MLRRTVAAAFAVAVVSPSSAQAQHTTCENDKLLASYSGNYHMVRKSHGKRAPGRNIRKWGISKKRTSSCRDIRTSRNTLRRMRHSGSRLLTAGKPYRPPAGTSTLRATNAPLAAIRQCESGGHSGYSTNTGNGFYGAYQFTQSTWESVGGTGNPASAPPEEQDRRAAMLYAREGAAPWPVCGQ